MSKRKYYIMKFEETAFQFSNYFNQVQLLQTHLLCNPVTTYGKKYESIHTCTYSKVFLQHFKK